MTYLLKDNNNKYLLKKKIGSGATCNCYLGQKITEETSELLAIKIFPQKYYEFYTNEISFLSELNENESIIKLYEYGQGLLIPIENADINNNDEEKNINENMEGQIIYYQVLEYAPNGELKDYINGISSRIPEKISAKLFTKIVKAVQYLHNNDIAHCDLKPENILLDRFFNPKINDFGFSQKFDGKNGNFLLHKRNGTPQYSSPDVRLAFTKGYDGIKNDIFSLGVLLFVITIGAFPFNSANYSDEKYKFIIKGRFKKFWDYFKNVKISDEFKDLINKLISLNPSKRLSTDEILRHPWITKNLGLNEDDNEQIFFSNELCDKDIIDEFLSRKNVL